LWQQRHSFLVSHCVVVLLQGCVAAVDVCMGVRMHTAHSDAEKLLGSKPLYCHAFMSMY
jgi:hypothetical protein